MAPLFDIGADEKEMFAAPQLTSGGSLLPAGRMVMSPDACTEALCFQGAVIRRGVFWDSCHLVTVRAVLGGSLSGDGRLGASLWPRLSVEMLRAPR